MQMTYSQMAPILNARWEQLKTHCHDRKDGLHCGHRNRARRGAHCDILADCPIMGAMYDDMASVERRAYIARDGREVYVERFAHNVAPWFIWRREAPMHCRAKDGTVSQVRSMRQLYAGETTLAKAQAKIDRMAARYGWQPCGVPDWVKDEVG